MTDSQIIQGIKVNSSEVWIHITRNQMIPFMTTLKRFAPNVTLSEEDWNDIFQDACLILMENIKADKFVERPGATLFSYFVEIGKRTMQSMSRKKAKERPAILVYAPTTLSEEPGAEDETSTEEKQMQQNEFLDRVFESLPEDCRIMLKRFYWDHMPMDEIASILGLRNANTAKTTKNRCMNKFKDIAAKLLESEEFAEDMVRACVERAALKELLASEIVMMNDHAIRKAALEVNENDGNTKDIR